MSENFFKIGDVKLGVIVVYEIEIVYLISYWDKINEKWFLKCFVFICFYLLVYFL